MGVNMMNATSIRAVSARPNAAFPMTATLVPAGPLGFEVGTGGAATFAYVRYRGNKGYPFAFFDWSSRVTNEVVGRTPVENLGHIRAVMGPTVTDLADILSVSRQAVYDWQAGNPVAEQNALKLSELARAADVFALEGLRGTSQALRRPIKNGKNFFELVGAGNPAEKVARTLVEIVRTESNQREALRRRLAGRKRPSREAFDEVGAPMLDEKE
jgi:transcriptional regulator with XRE-family HTH domain